MKRAVSILLIMMLVSSLCACAKTNESRNKTFAARILLAGTNSLTVTPDVTTHEYKTSDTIVASLTSDTVLTDTDGNAIDLSIFTTGTEVEITYDGTIGESYPARITAKVVRLKTALSVVLHPERKKIPLRSRSRAKGDCGRGQGGAGAVFNPCTV